MSKKRQAKRRPKRPGLTTSVPDMTKAVTVAINDPELAAATPAQQRGKKAPRSSSRSGRDFAASSAGGGPNVAGTDGSPTVGVRPGKREA
jgi:hypothetical protein